jgi:hypothetical protein
MDPIEVNESDLTAATPPVVVHHQARLSFMNALVAAVLVVAVGGFGFILGHDVIKSSSAASTQSRVANPYLPSDGSGSSSGFGGFGGFGSQPSISGPSQGSTSSS